MFVFDTLSGGKREFIPLSQGEVRMYVCGPTVYDKGHLGHGRSAVAFDVIRRYFEYKGLNVVFVSNYTDIDDKMIERAARDRISVKKLAEAIIPLYERDFGALGIKRPTFSPLATEYVNEMLDIIRSLLKKRIAYEIEDGIYFDISMDPAYGKLSKQKIDELMHGARVEQNEMKKNPVDFVLWKFKKEGEPSFKDKKGEIKEGRPGWHIECSAMSRKLLGGTFDIHGGGMDLIFPHHECEIAQSEMACGKPFANYWLHNGYVQISGEKMSKSLNNFKTLEDVLKIYRGNVVRYMLLATHYRSPIDFAEDLLEQAKTAVSRIQNFYDRVFGENEGTSSFDTDKNIKKLFLNFEDAMNDDFDTSGALAALFDFIKEVNAHIDKFGINREGKDKVLDALRRIDSVLGLISFEHLDIDEKILKIIEERENARKKKDFKTADKIRERLLKKGIIIIDTDSGTKWKKVI